MGANRQSELDAAFAESLVPSVSYDSLNSKLKAQVLKPLPDELMPVEPFPEAALPLSLRPWVADIADRLQCPLDMVAVPALVALSSLAARHIAIRPQAQTDWAERANLWGCIVARPGAMKSPAISQALAPIRRLEMQAQEKFDAGAGEFKAKRLAAELLDKANRGQAEKVLKSDPSADVAHLLREHVVSDEPVRERFVVTDVTYEALGQINADNPLGLLVARDELASLLRHLADEANASARGFMLQAWSGGAYTFDRISRGSIHIPDARLSLIGGIQPGPFCDLIRSAQGRGDDGLLQRFLVCWPDAQGEWRDVDRFPDSQAKRTAWQTFERLAGLDWRNTGAKQDSLPTGDPDGMPFVRLDPAALEYFKEWRFEHESKIARADNPVLESSLSKFRKHVPALALTIHLADSGIEAIDKQSIVRALALGDYFESHARRAYASGIRPVVAAAKTIISKLSRGKLEATFRARDVYRNQWSGLTDKELTAEALDLLVDHGHLIDFEDATTDSGGRPTMNYRYMGEVGNG